MREEIVSLLRDTVEAWQKDRASRIAAALSYYTILSLSPLLVIAIAVLGQIYADNARERIVVQASRVLGAQVAEALGVIVENAQQPNAGLAAGLIGVATLLVGASGVFNQLLGAFDTIWKVRPGEGRGILGTVKDRLLAFVMVVLIGALFFLSFLASTLLGQANRLVSGLAPEWLNLAPVLNIFLSLVLTTVLFAAIFKVLPRVNVPWRDVWVGAGVTAVLFVVGKELISLYLRLSDPSSGYGAAGSLIVLLIFVYYSAQIFLLGAEMTRLYAERYGRPVTQGEGVVSYRIVPEDEPVMRSVAATVAAEDVQMLARPVAAREPVPEGPGPRATVEGDREKGPSSFFLLFATVGFFLAGLIVGTRQR